MRKITFLLLMLLSITSYAQNDTTSVVKDEPITNAERVIDKYSGKAYEAVKELAAALKVPAEHVYTVLVKQAVVEAISYLIGSFILLVVGVIAIRLIVKNKDWFDWDYSPGGIFACLTSVACLIAGLLILTIKLDIIVGGFVNPEYLAIKEIISVLQ